MSWVIHHERVRELPCVVCEAPARSTVHHCHGGSIRQWFGEIAMPGMGQRQDHYLVIPLCIREHVGEYGIDNGMGKLKGVKEWEKKFGTQLSYLIKVADHFEASYGYNIFELARVPDPRSGERAC